MVWIVLGLVLTSHMVVVSGCRSRRDSEQMIGAPRLARRPRCHGRPRDARRRITTGRAGELLQAFTADEHDRRAHLDLELGAVFEAGEVSWGRSEAHRWLWSTECAWAWHSPVSWWGSRGHGVGREAVVSGWRDHRVGSARPLQAQPPTVGPGEQVPKVWSDESSQ